MELLRTILSTFQPSASFISDVIGIEAVLVGLAIPISFQVVTLAAQRLNDHELARYFFEEKLYRTLIFLLLANIIISLYTKFLGSPETYNLWILLIWAFLNIYLFYKFIRLVERYATDFDKIVLEKIKQDLDKFLKK